MLDGRNGVLKAARADPPMRVAGMDESQGPVYPVVAPDEELLRRCGAEAEAMSALFDRHGEDLSRYLYRLLGSREDAEEAVVDVFLRAWRAANGFRATVSVRSWLYRIAYHLAIDRLRVRSRSPGQQVPFSDLDAESVASPDDEPEAVFIHAYRRERDLWALRGALARLAPEDRALLTLHYLEGCSYGQIEEITGLSLARLRSRLHRARQRLKRHFVALRDSDEALDTLDRKPEGPACNLDGLAIL
jgi:RNA polymerase sigma-70 factor (ECF subfamily)